MHRPIELAVDRQVGPAIRMPGRQLFVDINSQAGLLAGMHPAILKRIRVRKNFVGLSRVSHVFLYTEVVDAQIKVKRGGHAYRAQVCRAVASGTYLINLSERSNFTQMSDSTGMHHGGPDVVNELLPDQLLAIENRIEDFAHSQRSRGVAAYQPESLLQLCGRGIFQPEEMIGFQSLTQPRRLN